MNIYSWMNSSTKTERKKLADSAATTVEYLWQLSGGHRKPSRTLAERLEESTKKQTPDRVISKVSALFNDSNLTA